MNAEHLLGRLEKVKRTGPGRWMARCPAHADKAPSLSVRELDDGRVLLHCWAGCETDAVLGAAGLTFADLFPEPLGEHRPRVRRGFNAADALAALQLEALVVMMCARDAADGKPVNRDRLLLAAQRISTAVEVTHG